MRAGNREDAKKISTKEKSIARRRVFFSSLSYHRAAGPPQQVGQTLARSPAATVLSFMISSKLKFRFFISFLIIHGHVPILTHEPHPASQAPDNWKPLTTCLTPKDDQLLISMQPRRYTCASHSNFPMTLPALKTPSNSNPIWLPIIPNHKSP